MRSLHAFGQCECLGCGQPFSCCRRMQLENPLGERESRPEAGGFLIAQEGTASRQRQVHQGKLAGIRDLGGGGADDGGGCGKKARPSQRPEMSIWTSSGSSEQLPCGAQGEEGSNWRASSGCEQLPSGGQAGGSSSQKGSSGCGHPARGVQKGGSKGPSGVALRTGSSRGQWGSPDRGGFCRASEYPPGKEGRKESSPLDGGELCVAVQASRDGGELCVAVQASQEGSSPCPAGRHRQAVGDPSVETGGATACLQSQALECGSSFGSSAQPGLFETGTGPHQSGSQCAEPPRFGQRECLGCGQPLSCCRCTGVAPRRITRVFHAHDAGA